MEMNSNINTAMQVAANFAKANNTIKVALNAINALYFVGSSFIPTEDLAAIKEAEKRLNEAYSNSDHHAAMKYIISLETNS